MKALILSAADRPLEIRDVEIPALSEPDAVLVRLEAAALNRRDYYISKGLYAKIQYPIILGSDGCGIAVAGHSEWLNKEVVINPSFDWGENIAAQSTRFSILGMPRNGTLAEYVAVPADRLRAKPKHLSAVQAAALPLAGVTAYRAVMTQGGCCAGQTVLITGIGGGVALFALQFANAVGAKVFCTSGSNEKLEKAETIGAIGTANYRNENWDKQLLEQTGGFDLIIDGAGGEQMNSLLSLCKPGGSVVSYGATLGAVKNLNLHRIFWKQIRLQGSTMGTDADFDAMLAFAERHDIMPTVDNVYSFDNATDAFARMEQGQQFGKIVVNISNGKF
ncbi:zinc-binding dehydrogenase [Ignavibacteria bacterium]|nr:zinc-binding dehydrogenase [Bacteroidota bacterium]MCZ2133685.1 zinc-binding dehydrogenase [Bacteroidota bacterium]